MSLREQLIVEIKTLPISDLLAIQHFLGALSTRQLSISSTIKKETTYLDTRQALRYCSGNLAEDILNNREDRF